MSDQLPHTPVGSRPLHQVVPDLERLLADPVTYLAQQEVRIGPLKPHWFFLFAGVLLAILGVFTLFTVSSSWLVICILFVGYLLMLYIAWPAPCEMVLRSSGVELCHGNTSVRCPWALFNLSSHPFVHNRRFSQEITLPVVPEIVPLVELWKDGVAVAQGIDIRSKHFYFLSTNEASIPAEYEANPQELGNLLLRLGTALDGSAPTQVVADGRRSGEAIGEQEHASHPTMVFAKDESPASDSYPEGVRPGSPGWIIIKLTRLQFPPICCVCCKPATEYYMCHVKAGDWMIPVISLGHVGAKEIRFSIPICGPCRAVANWNNAKATGIQILLACVPLSILYWISTRNIDVVPGLVLLLVVFCCVWLFKPAVGPPFQARYLVEERAVALGFPREYYIGELVNHLRSLQEP